MKKIFLALIIAAMLPACTMNAGELSDDDKNKIMECTDTRDGEVFYFNTNTIKNLRAGIGAPSTFDVVTTDGMARHLSSEMESWLKCEKTQQPTDTPPQ